MNDWREPTEDELKGFVEEAAQAGRDDLFGERLNDDDVNDLIAMFDGRKTEDGFLIDMGNSFDSATVGRLKRAYHRGYKEMFG